MSSGVGSRESEKERQREREKGRKRERERESDRERKRASKEQRETKRREREREREKERDTKGQKMESAYSNAPPCPRNAAQTQWAAFFVPCEQPENTSKSMGATVTYPRLQIQSTQTMFSMPIRVLK